MPNLPANPVSASCIPHGIRACGLVVCFCCLHLRPLASAPPSAGDSAPLASREQELANQFRELERSFLRLADLLAASDPRRSAVLRGAFERARDAEVGDRLELIVKLLEDGQLLKAGSSQATAIDKLQELLGLLEVGDAERQRATAKEDVKQFLSRVAKAIARQRDIAGSTEAGNAGEKLAGRQEKLAEETDALARDIEGFAKRMDARASGNQTRPAAGDKAGDKAPDEPSGDGGEKGRPGEQGPSQDGKPAQKGESPDGESSTPAPASQESDEKPIDGDDEASRAGRTRQRLDAAQRRMREAKMRLEESRRREARSEQEKAVEELETARAELEEILRQMREEEVEKLLVQLEARLRGMLRAERAVAAGVEKLAVESAAEAAADRERQLEAARLGRDQAAIGADAAKALVLVRDDGSAVAIPEALEQVRDDATQVATRLGRGDVGETTRSLLQDIVTGLEEMLAALEKAQKDQQSRQQSGAGGRPAEPGEQPLVDKLSELKMIRSLQVRVNTRTSRFSKLLDAGAERAEEPELLRALERLAERQRTIERAAHDIVTGRTE